MCSESHIQRLAIFTSDGGRGQRYRAKKCFVQDEQIRSSQKIGRDTLKQQAAIDPTMNSNCYQNQIENAVDPNQVPSFPAADVPASTDTTK